MKVRINVLKAPWPAGAVVGDVVEVASITPAFLGKCEQVSDDAPATVAFQTAAEAEAAAKEKAEAEAAAKLKAEQDAKAAAEAEAAALKAEAEALGIKVDGRWSPARVAEEIAKAKAK